MSCLANLVSAHFLQDPEIFLTSVARGGNCCLFGLSGLRKVDSLPSVSLTNTLISHPVSFLLLLSPWHILWLISEPGSSQSEPTTKNDFCVTSLATVTWLPSVPHFLSFFFLYLKPPNSKQETAVREFVSQKSFFGKLLVLMNNIKNEHIFDKSHCKNTNVGGKVFALVSVAGLFVC